MWQELYRSGINPVVDHTGFDQACDSANAPTRDLETRVIERTRELSLRTQELATLNSIATQLSRCLSSADGLSKGLELTSAVLRVSAGAIWLHGRDGRLELAGQTGVPELDMVRIANLPQRAPILERALHARTPTLLTCSDVTVQQMHLPILFQPGTSLLVVPLMSRRAPVGGMLLVSCDGRTWSDPEQQVAQAIGAQFGVALENVRRYEARGLSPTVTRSRGSSTSGGS